MKFQPMTRFENALAAIDAANACDPNTVGPEGSQRPAELVYAEHMSAMLAQLYPAAPEELKLAVRAQHLRRWEVPRVSYPMDRAGYHRWRNNLKRKHAEWAGEILRANGYTETQIQRISALIRKEGFKTDTDGQALEDTACLVFLSHYAEDFAAKHDDAKFVVILKKTWGKMSERAQQAALELSLPPRVAGLVQRALEETG
jgi:Domain of unknown function (DUF4202)